MRRCLMMAGIVLFGSPPILAAESDTASDRSHEIWSERPAELWQDAMVTGGGVTGAMVLGGTERERIILNHERLYEPLRDEPCPVPDVAFAVDELRDGLLSGSAKAAYHQFFQAAKNVGFPGLQWTDPYHPACAIVIDLPPGSPKLSDYRRSLDCETGLVRVDYDRGSTNHHREVFASRSNHRVAVRSRIQGDHRGQVRIRLLNQDARPPHQRRDEKGGGYEPPNVVYRADGRSVATIQYRCRYARSGRGYAVIARVTANGRIRIEDHSLLLEGNAFEMDAAITPLSHFDGEVEPTVQRLSRQLIDETKSFDERFEEHAAVHREIFGRVELDLHATDDQRSASIEGLLDTQASQKGSTIEPALLEKVFDMGRFALIASSGDWPPNLMGIWNGDWRPKWSGDFTTDANLNLQIAAATLGNLPEATASYTRLVTGLVDDWKINARNLMGCQGVLCGTRTDGRHNLHTHFSEGFPGCLWTAGATWMVLPMVEHFQTTGDTNYLRNAVLPILREIVQFYDDFLVRHDDRGHVIFVPSYSPENRPKSSDHSASINATMDIACARESLTNYLGFIDQFPDLRSARDERLRPAAIRLLRTLPPYQKSESGALKEWAWPTLDDNDNHRHVSHLYPVWPGHEITPENPEWFAAARAAAANRGRGNGSAHGLAHMALIASRLKDADLATGNLQFMLSSGYFTRGLFTYHNEGRIYNADMLCSLPAVVMEMIAYSRPGVLELLPAIDNRLSEGEIRGIANRNQTRWNRIRWDLERGELDAEIVSRIDQDIRLRVGIDGYELAGDAEAAVDTNGPAHTLHLIADQPLELRFRRRDASSDEAKTNRTIPSPSEPWQIIDAEGTPTARHEAALATHDGNLFLIGGRRINPVDCFDPQTRQWSRRAASPIELHHFQAVTVGDVIYMVGAMNGPWPNEQPLANVIEYHPKIDRFEIGDLIPEDRRRGGAGAVVHQDRIYLVGGITNGHMDGTVAWTDRYDPADRSWETLADAPTPRDHFQAVLIDGKIYAAAGRQTRHRTGDGFNLTIRQTDVFDIESGRWLPDDPRRNLPTLRAGNMAIAIDGQLVIGGGESGTQVNAHDEVQAYDPKTHRWQSWPSLQRGRHGSGFVRIGDRLYTASGCGNRGGNPELESVESLKTTE